jgi:excinuclease ABC subunit A
VVDIGPGAGVHGGEMVAQGTPAEIIRQPGQSLTGQYLTGTREIAVPPNAAGRGPQPRRHREGATGNNLKDVTPKSRWAPSPASPACRAAASPR